MTKINVKLLTSSTTVIEGVPGDYTVKTVSHSTDPRIKRTVNREESFAQLDYLAIELGLRVAATIARFYREGHVLNITIKDFEKHVE